jgi:hypothetical protein
MLPTTPVLDVAQSPPRPDRNSGAPNSSTGGNGTIQESPSAFQGNPKERSICGSSSRDLASLHETDRMAAGFQIMPKDTSHRPKAMKVRKKKKKKKTKLKKKKIIQRI